MVSDDVCWFCSSPAQNNVKKYETLVENPATGKKEQRIIGIPCCVSCEIVHKNAAKTVLIWFLTLALLGFIIAISVFVGFNSDFSGPGSRLGMLLMLPGAIIAGFVAKKMFDKVYLKAGIKNVKSGLQHPFVKNPSFDSSEAAPNHLVKALIIAFTLVIGVFGLVALVVFNLN